MCVRGGAHAGFIGKKTSGNAVANGFLQTRANDAARRCRRIECADDDLLESRQDHVVVAEDDGERAQDVHHSHERHHLFGKARDTAHAADEDEAGNGKDENAGSPLRNLKGFVEAVGNGVGLNHVADEAERDDDRDGKEGRKGLVVEAAADIEGRAAHNLAVCVTSTEHLSERSLGKNCSHAEESGKPHPEDGAGTAHGNGRGNAGEVAGADLCGNRSGERLEGTHTVLARLIAKECDAAEDLAEGLSEAADLNETQLDGEINASAHQKRD